MRRLPHPLPIEHLQRRLRMLDCGGCFANGVKGTNGLRLAGARLRVLRGVQPAVLAILHLLAMFVADLFKPRRQLEVKNLFFVTSSTSPSGVHRAVRGCVGATGRCWYGGGCSRPQRRSRRAFRPRRDRRLAGICSGGPQRCAPDHESRSELICGRASKISSSVHPAGGLRGCATSHISSSSCYA